MISPISQKLKIVQSTLVNVAGEIVFHYRRPANMKRFICWQEDAEDNHFQANNRSQEICITGTIDVYTPTEFDELIDNVSMALARANRMTAQVTLVDYEDQTGLIHYQWTFWVI